MTMKKPDDPTTEHGDSNLPEEQDSKRRKLIKTIAAGGGAVAVGKTIPKEWTSPIVESITLPAHAQRTEETVGGQGSAGGFLTSAPGGSIMDYFIDTAHALVPCGGDLPGSLPICFFLIGGLPGTYQFLWNNAVVAGSVSAGGTLSSETFTAGLTTYVVTGSTDADGNASGQITVQCAGEESNGQSIPWTTSGAPCTLI